MLDLEDLKVFTSTLLEFANKRKVFLASDFIEYCPSFRNSGGDIQDVVTIAQRLRIRAFYVKPVLLYQEDFAIGGDFKEYVDSPVTIFPIYINGSCFTSDGELANVTKSSLKRLQICYEDIKESIGGDGELEYNAMFYFLGLLKAMVNKNEITPQRIESAEILLEKIGNNQSSQKTVDAFVDYFNSLLTYAEKIFEQFKGLY